MRLARTRCPKCGKDVACRVAYDPVSRMLGDGTGYVTHMHRGTGERDGHRAEVDVCDVYWPDFPTLNLAAEPTKERSE